MHAAPHLTAPSPAWINYLAAVARFPLCEARPLALCLHIPSFAGDADPDGALDTYLGYLKREAAMHAVLLAGMSTIRQLSFEGAGASQLPECRLDALLAHLRRQFRFLDGDTAEHEATIDPGGVTPGRLARLRAQGFSRIRFELDAAGTHAGQLEAQVAAAHAAGLGTVCIAFPFGAPDQEFGQLRRILRAVLAAAPERVLPCHRPGAGRDEDTIIAGSVAQRMLQLCSDHLDMASYAPGGVDGWVRLRDHRWRLAERRRVPGQGLPRGARLLGCGVGARTGFGALACRNVGALYDYYALLNRNELPVGQLFQREQTEPYLMQVKDFRDANQ